MEKRRGRKVILCYLIKRAQAFIYDGYPNAQKFIFEKDQIYDLKLVVENEIVIIYVDETKVLSNRIYQAVNQNWGFEILSGDVEFLNIHFLTR